MLHNQLTNLHFHLHFTSFIGSGHAKLECPDIGGERQ